MRAQAGRVVREAAYAAAWNCNVAARLTICVRLSLFSRLGSFPLQLETIDAVEKNITYLYCQNYLQTTPRY